MQYTNTAKGNSGTLGVGGMSPGSGLPSYLLSKPTQFRSRRIHGIGRQAFLNTVVLSLGLNEDANLFYMYIKL